VLVDARRDHDRAEPLDDLAGAVRVVAVELVVARQEHGVARRELGRVADRHAGANAERARLVAARRDDAGTIALAADDDRPIVQARIEQALHRYEERVEIEAADPRRQHRPIV